MKQLERVKCNKLPGTDGINLSSLKEINCEILEILMRLSSVQKLLLKIGIALLFLNLQRSRADPWI